jgi:hypothetical protein
VGVMELVGAARACVAALETEAMPGSTARELVAGFAELERLAAAGKLLATARLVASGAGPGDDSFRDVDAWLASVSGTTVGAARAVTATAARLNRQDGVAEAVRTGALSSAQAELVSAAVQAAPHAQTRLIETAGVAGVKGLRAECDRVTAAALSAQLEADRAEHIHAHRTLRHTRLATAAPVPDGRRRGGRPLATLHVRVSAAAYRRGNTVPGEICEIDGA